MNKLNGNDKSWKIDVDMFTHPPYSPKSRENILLDNAVMSAEVFERL